MLFVSDYDFIQGPMRVFVISLSLSYSILLILISLVAISYSFKTSKTLSQNFFFGISGTFILGGISRIIFIIHDYLAPDSLDVFLWTIANVTVLSGLLLLTFIIEIYIYQETKHLFSIIGYIMVIIYTIMPDQNIAKIILYIVTLQLAVLPGYIYFVIIMNSKGEIRKRALILISGICIVFIGGGTAIYELLGLMDKWTATLYGPPVILAGVIVCSYGLIRLSKPIDESLINIGGGPDGSTVSLIEKMGLDFTKPKDLSEEEVNFFREQILCLVCRKDLTGFSSTFFCPHCKALYCESCARALSKLENICWSCDKAIDIEMPTVPFKEVGEITHIEQIKILEFIS